MQFPNGMLHPAPLKNPLDLRSLMDQGRREDSRWKGQHWTSLSFHKCALEGKKPELSKGNLK